MSHSKESDELVCFVNEKVIEPNADPKVNLLFYLRKVHLSGTKYACGGGGCRVCTVMVSRYNPKTKKIHHYPATACLVPICFLHGAAVTTVEDVGSINRIHPVQERLAECHGTRCGFCSPGMVMSIYTLLRNHPETTPDQITEALGGNLCHCTGYRPIVESGKTFCVESTVCQVKGSGKCCMDQEERPYVNKQEKICTKLCNEDEFQPFDPSQEPIFPPDLIRMAEDPNKRRLTFQGEKTTWIMPVTLDDVLELKASFPKAPLIMGNTAVGPSIKFKDAFYPVFISPLELPELHFVDTTDNGVTIGTGYSLAQLNDALLFTVSEQPKEKTKTCHALLKHLRTFSGGQIRNMVTLGGHVVSRPNSSDLNPILAAGNAAINLRSKERERQIPLNGHFLERSPEADLKSEEIVLPVYISHSTQATALVHIYLDGSVLVTHGGCELGQGLYPKMIQVASRELDIPQSYIHLSETSTITMPNAFFTAGSMLTDTNGKAVQNACQILVAHLQPVIRKNPQGKDWIAKAFKESISVSATRYFKGYQTNMGWEKEEGEAFPYFIYGAVCSEVEVVTGAHKLLRTDIFMDAAFSINPALDIEQIEGAFIQGVGLYTLEELKYSPEDVLYSRGPDDYKIPTVTKIPEEIYVTLVRSQNPIAIYSSKGLGEAGMFMGCSVLFAINHAVTAARRERGLTKTFTLSSPVTPELIRITCVDQFTDMIPRDDPSTFTPWSIHVS
ncbi:LOW QUALITY PROTEIN: aldehyde oxidase 4-like [Dugong dugon]